jgi:hypothetical protein
VKLVERDAGLDNDESFLSIDLFSRRSKEGEGRLAL